MEVEGKVIKFVRENSGIARSSGKPWRTKEYVLETKPEGNGFTRKIAFELFGDRVDQFPINVGDEIRLSFDIESREYQDRWYTSIRAWRVEQLGGAPAPTMGLGNPEVTPPPTVGFPPVEPADSSEDLPF